MDLTSRHRQPAYEKVSLICAVSAVEPGLSIPKNSLRVFCECSPRPAGCLFRTLLCVESLTKAG